MHPLAVPLALLLAPSIFAPPSNHFTGRHVYEPVEASDPFIGDSRQQSPGIGRELRNLRHTIREERDRGQLSGREAHQLKREAHAIERLAERYADDGLSRSEQAELENRTHYLSDAVKRRH